MADTTSRASGREALIDFSGVSSTKRRQLSGFGRRDHTTPSLEMWGIKPLRHRTGSARGELRWQKPRCPRVGGGMWRLFTVSVSPKSLIPGPGVQPWVSGEKVLLSGDVMGAVLILS